LELAFNYLKIQFVLELSDLYNNKCILDKISYKDLHCPKRVYQDNVSVFYG